MEIFILYSLSSSIFLLAELALYRFIGRREKNMQNLFTFFTFSNTLPIKMQLVIKANNIPSCKLFGTTRKLLNKQTGRDSQVTPANQQHPLGWERTFCREITACKVVKQGTFHYTDHLQQEHVKSRLGPSAVCSAPAGVFNKGKAAEAPGRGAAIHVVGRRLHTPSAGRRLGHVPMGWSPVQGWTRL